MKRLLLCWALGFSAAAANGQQPFEVRRGQLQLRVPLTGTVVAEDVVRLRAAVEGRVEDLDVSTAAWFAAGKPLGHLANKEVAAILDSHNTTESGVLEDRWKRVYQPTPIVCPKDCYVLRVFIKNREWLKSKSLLAEAAQKLVLVGRVRPEDARWIKDGQEFQFWAVGNPMKKFTARITHYVLDIQGQKVDPGGSFSVTFSPAHFLPPGTEWEGVVVPTTKAGVLYVPTGALIEYAGSTYLPIKVSTGLTTHEFTEVEAGAREKDSILVLDDAGLKEGIRHRRKPEDHEFPVEKARPDPDAIYGDDPYAQ